jgi:hypothetical protein
VADPRREHGTPARAADHAAAIRLRAGRPPRPANDNGLPWLKRVARLAPLVAAVALLVWALVHAFGVP